MPLGVIHRDVCVAQHIFGIAVVAVAGRDADARGHGNPVAIDIDRCGETCLHPGDDRMDGRGIDVVQQHGKLVTAETSRHVGRPQPVSQALADMRQQTVTGEMAERVVDQLEPIEVEEHDGIPQP